MLTLAAGVAVVEAVSSATGLDSTCRWPNDVFVGERHASFADRGMAAQVIQAAARAE